MSKQILIDAVKEQGLSNKDATAAVETVLGTIQSETAAKGKFTIPGHGTYEKRERAARKGRNPQSGEQIDIAASKNVGFKAGKAFKDQL